MTAREFPTASATLRKLLDISKRDEWPTDELDALEIAIHAVDNVPDLLAALELIARSDEVHGDTVVCDFSTLQSVARSAIKRHATAPESAPKQEVLL